MGKPDDLMCRWKEKMQRYKRDSSSKVSTRSASIIAAKKRRQYVKRRLYQRMYLRLPTQIVSSYRKRKRSSKEIQIHLNKKNSRLSKGSHNPSIQDQQSMDLVESFGFMGSEIALNVGKPTFRIMKREFSKNSWKENNSEENKSCPSKFLTMCLSSIEDGLLLSGDFSIECERPFFANAWGLEFWNCYDNGKDVLEINSCDSTVEQIAWVASTAADTISMKEKEGASFDAPFLLYLVPSQDKVYKVSQVCDALNSVGICTMSLHSDSDIHNQIHSLKSCEPEFVISTPERLFELLSLKAVDISEVNLLVIDGVEAPLKGSYFDAVKSIRQFISRSPQTVVFCDNSSTSLCLQ